MYSDDNNMYSYCIEFVDFTLSACSAVAVRCDDDDPVLLPERDRGVPPPLPLRGLLRRAEGRATVDPPTERRLPAGVGGVHELREGGGVPQRGVEARVLEHDAAAREAHQLRPHRVQLGVLHHLRRRK
eukprot:3389791-Pyramimonas_sp.AAC.1